MAVPRSRGLTRMIPRAESAGRHATRPFGTTALTSRRLIQTIWKSAEGDAFRDLVADAFEAAVADPRAPTAISSFDSQHGLLRPAQGGGAFRRTALSSPRPDSSRRARRWMVLNEPEKPIGPAALARLIAEGFETLAVIVVSTPKPLVAELCDAQGARGSCLPKNSSRPEVAAGRRAFMGKLRQSL